MLEAIYNPDYNEYEIWYDSNLICHVNNSYYDVFKTFLNTTIIERI